MTATLVVPITEEGSHTDEEAGDPRQWL